MATKIQLTPGELQAQATEMQNLESEYSALFAGVSSNLKSLNRNWSANLSNNFEGKINSAQKSFTQLTRELINGSKVANTCAVTFESVDSQLSKLYCTEETKEADRTVAYSSSDWLNGDWIDEQFPNLPVWAREHLKKLLEKAGDKFFGKGFSNAADIYDKVCEGEYLDALKDAVEYIYKNPDEKGFFKDLPMKFMVNSVFGMVEEYVDYWNDPSLINLLNIGWTGTVGAVLETASDKAWGLVKYIPGISTWYEKHGATDGGEAFNVAYTEMIRTIWGDEMADYCGSYYAENGGLFGGLFNGCKEINSYIIDSCKRHNGIVGVWLNGWNSIIK